jgi:hypothetical protein
MALTHFELVHETPHEIPQPPQLPSFVSSTQVLPHRLRPVLQTHLPLWQVIPPPQTVPQDPQLLLSELKSTQFPDGHLFG